MICCHFRKVSIYQQVKLSWGLSFNYSCIGWPDALPLMDYVTSLAVMAYSAGLPVLWSMFLPL